MIQLLYAKPLPHYNLWLEFSDGVQGQVDLSHLVGQGVFALWNDENQFAQMHAERSAIVWNDEVDVDTTALYLQITGKSITELWPSLRETQHA